MDEEKKNDYSPSATRRAEEDLLVTKRLKQLAVNLCEPLIDTYQVCVYRDGWLKTKLGFACAKEKTRMDDCFIAISNDQDAYDDCRRIYIDHRTRHSVARKTFTKARTQELWEAYEKDMKAKPKPKPKS